MKAVNEEIQDFRLMDGFSAETSGGLLMMLPENKANDFMKELLQEHGQTSWKVGEVVKGSKQAQIISSVQTTEVKEFLL